MESFMKYINRIYRCSTQYRGEKMADTALGGCQISYVFHVCKNPGVSQDTLASLLYVNKSNVTRQITQLQEEGFVTRQTSSTDRRVIEIYPTQKALDLMPRIRLIMKKWNEYLTEDMNEEEKIIAINIIQKIAEKAVNYHDGMDKENNICEL